MKNTIQFFSGQGQATEVLRLSRDGIWANPNIPADDAAKLVLEALGQNINVLVQKAIEAEREACAKVCDEQIDSGALSDLEKYRAGFIADAIRAREQA